MKTIYTKTLFIIMLSLLPILLFGQTKLQATEGSFVKVNGTSTLHDWEMVSSQMENEAEFKLDAEDHPLHLTSISFSLETETLKSDNKKLDRNAYEALKTSEHPKIKFKSTSYEIIKKEGNTHLMKIKGMLTIAGVTKEKTVEAKCENTGSGTHICSGETDLKMTDFSVEPPSFMFGAMKTGNEITISYKIIYK